MAKHLRPISESYTDFREPERDRRLGRGLHHDHEGDQIRPAALPGYLSANPKALLRQTIAVLDKVVKKRNRLSAMHPEAYRDRVYLAEALWMRLIARIREVEKIDEAEISELRRLWNAKSHPYAMYEVVPSGPLNDRNGQAIQKYRDADGPQDPVIARTDFEGVWHGRFWQEEPGRVDYGAIADRIIAHLFDQEIVIGGGPRRIGSVSVPKGDPNGTPGPETRRGLIVARGEAISRSASDPRTPSGKLQAKATWTTCAEARYFGDDGKGGSDIAKAIFEDLEKPENHAGPIYPSWFGSRLFDHFGSFKDSLPLERKDPFKDQIWALHNAVRQYYQRLAKSDRFRIALRKAQADVPDKSELLSLLPRDREDLLLVLGGKKRNAEMSEFIRLGKLFVHASDALHDFRENDPAALEAFEKRMTFLATSIGQSEIKQIETFARTWRGAVGLTLRTLKGLADPKGKIGKPKNRDISAMEVMIDAFKQFDQRHFERHIPIIFGSKHLKGGDCPSRASIFTGNKHKFTGNKHKSHQAELLWAMMCVVSTVRNRTNHFNVRRALIRLLEGGIVHPIPGDPSKLNVDNRKPQQVSPAALDAFKELLEFDLAIQKDAVRTALKQAKAAEFVEMDNLKRLVAHLAGTDDITALNLPRFAAVMDKVRRLADNDDVDLAPGLVTLQKSQPPKDDQTENDAARCRYRLLLELYQSGFRCWLSGIQSDAEGSRELCHWAVQQVGRSKDARKTKYDARTKRYYRSPISLIDDLGLDRYDDILALLDALAAQSTREQGQDLKYTPDARVQRQGANRIEEFRQELFAHIFARYLAEPGPEDPDFGWIGEIDTRRDCCDLDEALNCFQPPEQAFRADWHSQFYAWLYMVPPIEASRLRHQMRKSASMDGKWSETLELSCGERKKRDERAQGILADMDRLFSLYTKVQAAGFSGQEHEGALEDKGLFYQDASFFKEVYQEEGTANYHTTFPGTRSGLRQLVRYAHLPPLTGIFKKHKVTEGEVKSFAGLHNEKRRDPDKINCIKQRESLRKEILQSTKDIPKPKDKTYRRFLSDLEGKCRNYQTVATAAAIHNFQANGARLNDHVRLHQIAMRVLTRLTDYTLIWERDRLFAFIGMLYKETGGAGLKPAFGPGIKRNASPQIGILVTAPDLLRRAETEPDQVFIPYLDPETGFDAPPFEERCKMLSEDHARKFQLHFINAGERSSELALRSNEKPGGYDACKTFKRGSRKQDIRNDLAHHNILDLPGRRGLNLTYVVNAVRSLMSYDRKLKNAVPKSIKRILGEEGLIIEWQMKDDRLKKPTIYPDVETHLTMVPPHMMSAPVSFTLPRASVRLVSMTRAMFDFGGSGYGDEVVLAGKTVKQAVYPDAFTARFPQTPETLKRETRLVFTSEKEQISD